MLKSSLQEGKGCNEKRSGGIFLPSKSLDCFDSWLVLVVSAPWEGRAGAKGGATEGKHLKASFLGPSFVGRADG